MEGYGNDQYGRSFADVYDDWYREVSDVDATVARVAALAARRGGGRVLELGVGTGRLALPLAARGLAVTGVDASPEMLERLRAKDGVSQQARQRFRCASPVRVQPPLRTPNST